MATTTAEQRRAESKREFESFLATCPSRDLLATLGSKWVTLVLASLADKPLRYNAIRSHVAGISPKMLTQTLRTLERDGLLDRTVIAAVPVEVVYSLTPLGRDLLGIVLNLKAWAEDHIATIGQSRNAYDSRQQLISAPR
jgi:DNA-binding HxlR family transcriptional regulator